MSDTIDVNGGGVIVNPVDPVNPTNGGGSSAGDIIIDSNASADTSLQGTSTAENQISDYMAAYMLWAARLLGRTEYARVKPGSLVML